MANDNKISATLADTDRDSVINYIVQSKQKLPFLIALSNEDRTKLRKMGPKSVDYVNLNLKGAQNFPNTLPADFNTIEFGNDVSLINQLVDIRVPLASLLEGIDDTILAAGSDAMMAADTVYSYLKTAANKNASVKALVAEIAQRFAGQGKKKAPPVDPKK